MAVNLDKHCKPDENSEFTKYFNSNNHGLNSTHPNEPLFIPIDIETRELFDNKTIKTETQSFLLDQNDIEEINHLESSSNHSEISQNKSTYLNPNSKQRPLASTDKTSSNHKITINLKIFKLTQNIDKNLIELYNEIKLLSLIKIERKSKSLLICEYLFDRRRDQVGITFTRAHNRMLKNSFNGVCCSKRNSIHYTENENIYFQKFHSFANKNFKVLQEKCKINEKLTFKLFNSAFWKDYFCTDIVVESFHLCIDCIFSEENKDILRNRIKKKILDVESLEIWELRKKYLKSLLFIVN